MRKVLVILLLCAAGVQAQTVRYIMEQLAKKPDTTLVKTQIAAAVASVLPGGDVFPFTWRTSGGAAISDTLRFIQGSNITLTQSARTLTIAGSAGGSTDTTSLSNRINLKADSTDRATRTLVNIFRNLDSLRAIVREGLKLNITDTTSFSNQFSLRVKYSDSANVFQPRAQITTALALKANLAGPTFTGTVTIPTPFKIGAVSMTATGTELNYVSGVTSAIQTQLGTKAPTASPTFTGTVTLPVHNLFPGSGLIDSVKTSDTLFIGWIYQGMTIDTIRYSNARGAKVTARLEMVDSLYAQAGWTLIDTTTVITQRIDRAAAVSGGTFTLTAARMLRMVFSAVQTMPKQFVVTILGH